MSSSSSGSDRSDGPDHPGRRIGERYGDTVGALPKRAYDDQWQVSSTAADGELWVSCHGMFGRTKRQTDGEEDIPVDAALEGDIALVEQSIAEYLKNPTDASRQSLLVVLKRLDDQTDRSDAYDSSVIGSAALGYASKGEVLGETSIESVVEEVPGAELKAQVALVKAAKNEVRWPSLDTFASLQSAYAALSTIRDQPAAGP